MDWFLYDNSLRHEKGNQAYCAVIIRTVIIKIPAGFTYIKLVMETPEQFVNLFTINKKKQQNNTINVAMVSYFNVNFEQENVAQGRDSHFQQQYCSSTAYMGRIDGDSH